MNNFIRIMVLMLAVTASAACLSQPSPEKQFYSLVTPVVTDGVLKNTQRRTLLVSTASTAAGYDSQGFVYRVGPDKYERDFYNDFMAPPARLIVDAVTQYMDANNELVRVVKTPGLILASYDLGTYLESIYGDYTVTPPQAVINIRFSLTDLRSQNPRVLLDQTYQQKIAFTETGATGLVAAFNVGLGNILVEFNKDAQKALK